MQSLTFLGTAKVLSTHTNQTKYVLRLYSHMKKSFIFLSFLIPLNSLSMQTITSQIAKDTVHLWANAKFISVDDFKKEIEQDNAQYGTSRKYKPSDCIYNSKGEIVTYYNDLIISADKLSENNKSQFFFITIIFWDIELKENVSTVLSLTEVNKIISYLKITSNIDNLKEGDIVSFQKFRIMKDKDSHYISIKDIYYGDRLTNILYNSERNEFKILLNELEKMVAIINKQKFNK